MTSTRAWFVGCSLALLSACSLTRITYVGIYGPPTAPAGASIRLTASENAESSILGRNPQQVSWSLISGACKLKDGQNLSITLMVAETTTDTSCTVRANSVINPSISADYKLAVIAIKTVLPRETFETSNNGWLEQSYILGAHVPSGGYYYNSPATFGASGGNPGGHLRRSSVGYEYFDAAADFLGRQSRFLNANLEFDLVVAGSETQFDSDDVVLIGGGFELVAMLPKAPSTVWTKYSIPFSTAGDWRVGSRSGPLASRAQIAQTLEFVTALWIRSGWIEPDPYSKFQTSTATTGLDNVTVVKP